MPRAFQQVDVFTTEPFLGNPVAVVLDGEGLSDDAMQRIADWTNLSETTFVLPPTDDADYRVRIFTKARELPFAGHPTLGTCHAWLGGRAQDEIAQECAAGIVRIRRTDDGLLAFAAPPLIRGGPVEPDRLERLKAQLGVDHVVDATWADNGPGWVALLLASAEEVLALTPRGIEQPVGVVGLHPDGSPELRAFGDDITEDPVTGSLNASVAQWLLGTGRLTAPYVARQGTALGRAGRIHVSEDDGEIWIGGGTITVVEGKLAE